MTQSRLLDYARPNRRSLLKSAALGSVAAIAAPYVKDSYAAGTLALGVWDHWVPGANNTLTKLCNEWGAKNNCEVKIDYITSQGEKDKLTAAAEAQAGTGHDIMSHRDWNIRIHQNVLEPLDDVVDGLIKQYGPISPVAEYLAKIKGTWRGVPTTVGSQVKPCCSRFDLYQQHAGIDLRDMFPADELKWDKAKIDNWNWDTYLDAAQKLYKAGFPVGLPMGQSSDAVDWVGALFNSYGVVMVDAKDNIKINSDETRAALGVSQEADGGEPAGGLRLGRRRQQPLAHFRQGLGHHESAERLGGRQARQSESGGEMLDPSDAARPERPLRRAASAILRPVVVLQEQAGGEGSSDLHLAEGVRSRNWSRRRSATICRRSRACTISTPGRRSSRRSAPFTAIRRAATSRPRSPARRRAPKSAPRSTIRRSTP